MRPFVIIVLLNLAISAQARIGETSLQFVDRYGPPKDSKLTAIFDKQYPLVENAIHYTYEYQGWKIRAAFLQLDGPAVRMDFQKLSGTGNTIVIQDYELQAIASANSPPGMSWKPIAYDNPDSPNKGLVKMAEGLFSVGQMMWQRTDGAILWRRSDLIVRLELSAARQYEARRKVAKDQKARASVPNF